MVNIVTLVGVAPARERGLKFVFKAPCEELTRVAPARERGLKFLLISWLLTLIMVAPARERGLKFVSTVIPFIQDGRSREGAWIEIHSERACNTNNSLSLPRGSVD